MSTQLKKAQGIRAEQGPDADALKFKKTEHVVDHPGITENLNDEYIRNPPNNAPPNAVDTHARGENVGANAPKKDVDTVQEPPTGAGEGGILARPPRLDAERQPIDESDI